MSQTATSLSFEPIDSLNPAPYNPRHMTAEEMNQLKLSITDFGMVLPIVINKDKTIIGGHQRVTACRALGISSIPCVTVDLPRTREIALNIALNKITGEWDMGKLDSILTELDQADIDPQSYGFTEGEIHNVHAQIPEVEGKGTSDPDLPDPEDITDPVSIEGELYDLGPHRLICGDSTKGETYTRLLDGDPRAPAMYFTDPPYNIDYESKARGKIKNDAMSPEAFQGFCDEFFARVDAVIRPGAAAYVCCANTSVPPFLAAMARVGWEVAESQFIAWVKETFNLGRGDFQRQYEGILYVQKPGDHFLRVDRSRSDVWNIRRVSGQRMVHPTEKPVAMIREALRNSSKVGDLVLDTFGGSGATLEAAHQMDRGARLIELDPRFCDVIRMRVHKLTGGAAAGCLAPPTEEP